MHKHEHGHHHGKTEKNILVAFFLNIGFAIFELIGGFFTSSVSIISDAIHDAGDALSIGLSFLLERKSNKVHDDKYSFGYRRYSTLGALITTIILLVGASLVIYNSIIRLFNPVEIKYDGMIIIAVLGVIVNFLAAYFTREGDSLNQHAVNLHMLEDVLGWIVVLIGSIIIKFTNFYYIDSIMSIGISVFLIIESIKNLKQILDLILVKVPEGLSIDKIHDAIMEIKGISDVHHIHVWSMDGEKNYATMHVVSDNNVKGEIRSKLKEIGIDNVTIELEKTNEKCMHKECC